MTRSAPVLGHARPSRTAGQGTGRTTAAHALTAAFAERFRPGEETGRREPAGLPAGLRTGLRECLVLAASPADDPDPAVAVELVGRAAEWAREGIDLDIVLRTLHETVRRELAAIAAERRRPEELPAVTDAALRLLETVTVATTAAYLDEHRQAARHHQTAAQALVTALLSGHGRVTMARHAGISVAPAYQVVALAIPPLPTERNGGVGAESAARRKLRRLQSALAPALGSRALSLLSVDGGIVLVPLDPGEHGASGRLGAQTMTADTVEVLSEAASVPLTAVVVAGDTDRIPELARQARELLDLVRSLGRPPGLYRLADVAMEYQLTRPGPAREHLAALLGPLAPHPDLLETLRIYLDSGLDRKVAARRLNIHPNSVSHRVRRVERLAGVDLSHPAGISRASLALLANDLLTDSRTKEFA
ncbi:PucR family transcriptional regulator [Nocardia sp. alder85J]|uniref:PucR family transcriptional regulator n=1 Tax=Nocardia sp. alder85J TaxID=2862949 RepID=UPI001CD2C555|nr:PucR family transcriptional regulator [Nocardia sp. alder85J]MCX4092625.1 helix-turn-helix domain-containing protein [Nocardia sp. alder85J]